MGEPTRLILIESDSGRFWTKVDASGDCWEWRAATNAAGYGIFHIGGKPGKTVLAHRVAWTLLLGSIPPKLSLDHLCRNRACVNPDHLDLVSQRTNVLRGYSFSAVNAAKTHCSRGHEYTPENTRMEKYGARRCRTCERARPRRGRKAA